jgi:hypothetical protein
MAIVRDGFKVSKAKESGVMVSGQNQNRVRTMQCALYNLLNAFAGLDTDTPHGFTPGIGIDRMIGTVGVCAQVGCKTLDFV